MGGMAGFTPRQIDRMSLWEYAAVVDGFVEIQTGKRPQGDISEARLAEMGIVGFEDG